MIIKLVYGVCIKKEFLHSQSISPKNTTYLTHTTGKVPHKNEFFTKAR